MSRPTPEEIAEARQMLIDGGTAEANGRCIVDDGELDAIRTLLAATEPPTDDDIVRRYKEFLERKGYQDRGHAIWFADGVEAFIGRKREKSCVCGKCPVKP